jgi:hypothetical protein
MPGQEERILREQKRLQKRRVTKRNRSQARKRLQEANFEAAAQDDEVPPREQVKDLHIGQRKPRRGTNASTDA